MLKIIPLIIISVMTILIVINKDKITIGSISEATPQKLIVSVLFIFALYAIKSLSVMFPLMLLMVSCGYIFGTFHGIILSIFGTAITLTIPYIIGRFSVSEDVETLFKKYPRLEAVVHIETKYELLYSLFTRTLFFMPCDVLSFYMGSIKMTYYKYIIGGVIGFLPTIIAAGYIGSNITNPDSAEFILPLIVSIIVTIISMTIYIYIRKKHKKNDKKSPDTQ